MKTINGGIPATSMHTEYGYLNDENDEVWSDESGLLDRHTAEEWARIPGNKLIAREVSASRVVSVR